MSVSPNTRARVIQHDGYVCRYCGMAVVPNVSGDHRLSLDHIHPKAHGGSDCYENLVVACGGCNMAKGDTIPTSESRWWLGTPGVKVGSPRAPRSKERPPPLDGTYTPPVRLTQTIGSMWPELEVMAGHGLESKWLEGCDCRGCIRAHDQANGLRGFRNQPLVHRPGLQRAASLAHRLLAFDRHEMLFQIELGERACAHLKAENTPRAMAREAAVMARWRTVVKRSKLGV